jgi:hypothetical protein
MAAAAGPGLACGEEKGGLMLAVTTDMLAPKDVNVVSVSIQVGPAIKYNFIGRVTPEGEVLLPATLAIVEPDDPNATIRVRVIAFKDTKPRVLRDVTTTSPRAGRVALLRMPLSFVNDNSATGALPADNLPPSAAPIGGRSLRPLADPFNPYGAEVVSVCTDPDQTMIDGECANMRVDSATLPDYSDALIFPGGDRAGQCFAPTTCFEGWRKANVDLDTCTAPKDGDVTNVTLVTADTGACGAAGQCFVPIDRSDEGWKDIGDRVQLPKGVCKKLREGAELGFVGGARCATKTPDFPVCTGGPSVTSDAGTDAGDAGTEGIVKLAEANGAYGLAVLDDSLFYGTSDGLFQVAGGQTTKLPFSPASPRLGPWFIAQHDKNILFVDGTAIAASGDIRAMIRFPNNTIKPVGLNESSGNRPTGAALGATNAWVPFIDGVGSSGNVLATDFVVLNGPTNGFVSPLIRATAVAHVANDHLWIGDEFGNIQLCNAAATPFTCDASASTDAATETIDGMATARATIDQAFILRRDGIFFGAKELGVGSYAIKRLTTDDLSGIDDSAYYPRGIAATAKCAFYASPRGLEYMSADGTGFGVLAPKAQGEVVSVVAPVPQSGIVTHAYFVVRDSIGAGGGIYRVGVPSSCQ